MANGKKKDSDAPEPEVVSEPTPVEPVVVSAPAELPRNIRQVIEVLEGAERQGSPVDKPEGMRWIILTDTLAKKLVALLKGE